MSENTLEIKGLKTQFFTRAGIVRAVDGIELVGESGCGKSMTAMSVMQLLQSPGRIVEGEIFLEGDNLVGKKKRQVRALRGDKMSMIFQEPMTSLNPVLRVGRQVSEPLILHRGFSKAQAKEKAIETFRSVGIPEPEKRYNSFPHQLSGGLRQRVMIGMAMICEPSLLIADEPTTALDVTIEAQILQLMSGLQRSHSTSIVLITHNLGIVAELCSYVYVMYAGKIMEEANVFDIFREPLHPYTKGLLGSIPSLSETGKKLYTIRGMVPNLLSMPEGCRFAPRCDFASAECLASEPELSDAGGGRKVRCYRAGRKAGAA